MSRHEPLLVARVSSQVCTPGLQTWLVDPSQPMLTVNDVLFAIPGAIVYLNIYLAVPYLVRAGVPLILCFPPLLMSPVLLLGWMLGIVLWFLGVNEPGLIVILAVARRVGGAACLIGVEMGVVV